jgi:Ca2+/H+ antiporter, TMEM165/GDT1 family
METLSLHVALPAVGAAFLASLVEVVEAFTIVLAVGTTRGWRPALQGSLAGLVVLALLVATLGPALDRVPLHWLQLAIGILLLLFGLRWLRKAILRAANIIPLHDETAAFAAETAELGRGGSTGSRRRRLSRPSSWKGSRSFSS